MSKVLLLLLLWFCAVTPLCSQSHQSLLVKKYPPAQLRQDAMVLRDVVLAMHPVIGIYKTRDYYIALFDQFIQNINDSLTQRDFRLRVKLLMDEMHCGHTEVLYSSAFYKEVSKMKFNFSPYIFLPVRDKVYMIGSMGKNDSLLKKGTEITSINGIPVDSMLRYSRRFISSDGYIQTSRQHYVQRGFNSYYVSLFGRPDTFTVEYTDGRVKKQLKYAAMKPKNLPALPIGYRDDSLFTRHRRAGIKYRFMDADRTTMLLKVEKFSNVGYRRAYRRVFRKMDRHNSKNLVIDLRNNGGGSLNNTYKLLSYLINEPVTQTLRTSIRRYPFRKYTSGNIWFRLTRLAYRIAGTRKTTGSTEDFIYTIKPRKRHHFNDRVLVLLNGGSFSAAALVAAYLKTVRHAEVIGEESGGAMEGCNAGVTPYYKLPHTGLRVRLPAFRVVHDVSPQITGQGVLPDYKTEYSLKDIVGGRDLELQKAKELLKIP